MSTTSQDSAPQVVLANDVDDRLHKHIVELVERYGRNTTSFQLLERGTAYYVHDSDACIGFAPAGGAWVVAGAPLCAPARQAEVLGSFLDVAAHNKKRVRIFAAETGDFSWLSDPSAQDDLRALKIGEQPVWQPGAWPSKLAAKRSLREQLRRARAKGVRIRALQPHDVGHELRGKLARLRQSWLESRGMAPMAFLVSLELFAHAERKLYLIAERKGELLAFASMVPVYARDGWFLEDLLRADMAPNGTVELLIDAAMTEAHARSASRITLGLAPLAGVESRWLARIRDHSDVLYHFRGVYDFKAKLCPDDWEDVHLAFPRRERGARALVDVLRAFAGGSFLRFGWRTLVHRARAVTLILALLLIPWTLAMAIAGPTPYFPSSTVHKSWLIADGVLFSLLLLLAMRWRDTLAIGLSVAAALDFGLGCVQFATHNHQYVDSGFDLAITSAALAAPVFASLFLWSCRRRSRLYAS